MKIVTKPLTSEDEIDKSRHVTGFNRWARSSRVIGIIMLIVEWFCIPFEVIFRRDFGQRWFTVMSYFAGFVLITAFSSLQFFWTSIIEWLSHFSNPLNPFHADPDAVKDLNLTTLVVMGTLTGLYEFMGLYHLFKIKWRNQANTPQHSFDDGTSRFLWLTLGVMWIFNILAVPLMFICWLLIPRKQRKGKPFPKLIHNLEAFTGIFFEPVLLFFIAAKLTSVNRVYFILSGIALFIQAQRKELARKNKILDFQDSKMEAETMKELRNLKMQNETAKATNKTRRSNVQPVSKIAVKYPHLSVIIEEMNKENAAKAI